MNKKYLTNFKNKKDIETSYDTKLSDDIEILLAWYGYGSYDGSSFVLFRQNGKLYEVNGSHCSCFRLEGQWKPEETTVKSLKHIVVEGKKFRDYSSGEKEYGEILLKILNKLDNNA